MDKYDYNVNLTNTDKENAITNVIKKLRTKIQINDATKGKECYYLS